MSGSISIRYQNFLMNSKVNPYGPEDLSIPQYHNALLISSHAIMDIKKSCGTLISYGCICLKKS